jgi:hypothetical protein
MLLPIVIFVFALAVIASERVDRTKIALIVVGVITRRDFFHRLAQRVLDAGP